MFPCNYYLLQIILVVAQTEVDVRLEAAELDRSSIVRPVWSKLTISTRLSITKLQIDTNSNKQKAPNLAAACAVSKPPG